MIRGRSIAVVEDDEGIRTALAELLKAVECTAETFASAEAFLQDGLARPFDALVADVNLPGMTGVALLETLAARGVTLPAVLITGRDDRATREVISRAGAVPLVRKPFSDDELFDALERVLPRTM